MPEVFRSSIELSDEMGASLQFQEAFRPATCFTNVEIYCGPYEIMTDTEVKVLSEMALLLLNSLPTPPLKGSLRIYGQRRHGGASPIIKADLNQGFFKMHCLSNSDIICDNTITRATRVSEYEHEWHKFLGLYSLDRHYPEDTEVYTTPSDSQFLNVAALYGHFVLCLNTEAGRDQDELALWGLAQTIALLRRGDDVMAHSLEAMRPLLLDHGENRAIYIMDTVQRMFANLDFAVLRSWKNCRNIAEVVDVNHLFFA